MNISFYIPALLTLVGALVGFIVGVFGFLLNFPIGLASRRQDAGLVISAVMIYAAPVAALIAIGMQIAHWV